MAVGIDTSEMLPAVVMRPILFPKASVNQRRPSGPATMPNGNADAVGRENSVIVPLGVILPILLLTDSVNQRLPSAPAAIPSGKLNAVGSLNSVMTPSGVTRATWSTSVCVTQRLPSPPLTMLFGPLAVVGRSNSVIVCAEIEEASPRRSPTTTPPTARHLNATDGALLSTRDSGPILSEVVLSVRLLSQPKRLSDLSCALFVPLGVEL